MKIAIRCEVVIAYRAVVARIYINVELTEPRLYPMLVLVYIANGNQISC